MSYVVIEYHHDPDAGVYRVLLGREVADDVPVVEEIDGREAVLEVCSQCGERIASLPLSVLSEDDAPSWDGHADGCARDGQPPDELKTERKVVGYQDVRDVAFADDDERWAGKSDDEIADEQLADITAQLDREARLAEEAAAAIEQRREMPGAGRAL